MQIHYQQPHQPSYIPFQQDPYYIQQEQQYGLLRPQSFQQLSPQPNYAQPQFTIAQQYYPQNPVLQSTPFAMQPNQYFGVGHYAHQIPQQQLLNMQPQPFNYSGQVGQSQIQNPVSQQFQTQSPKFASENQDLLRHISFGAERQNTQHIYPSQTQENRTACFGSQISMKDRSFTETQPSLTKQPTNLSSQPSTTQTKSTSQQEIQFVKRLSEQLEHQLSQTEQQTKTRVQLKVKCKTELNEQVAIVGNIPQLGCWDFRNALMLQTTEKIYPLWYVETDLPKNTTIEYKYIKIVNNHDGETNEKPKEIVWEMISGNRVVNTHGRARIVLQEEFSSTIITEEDCLKEEQISIKEPARMIKFPSINVSPILHMSQDQTDSGIHQHPPRIYESQFKQTEHQFHEVKTNQIQNIQNRLPQEMPKNQTRLTEFSTSTISRESLPRPKKIKERKQKSTRLEMPEITLKQSSYTKIQENKNPMQTDDLKFAQRSLSNPDDSELDINSHEFMKQQLQKAFKDYKYGADNVQDKYAIGITAENEKIDGDSESTVKITERLQHAKKHPSFSDSQDKPEADIQLFQKTAENKTNNFQPKSRQTGIIMNENIDPKEPIILCTFYLPYKILINPKKPDQFIAHQCYHNPTFLYGLLDNMAQQKTYNFLWIGIISTQHKFTEYEQQLADEALLKKNCYAIYLTAQELEPFMKYYEGLLRPRMHNFFDPFDISQQDVSFWNKYNEVSMKVAAKVNEVRLLHPQLTMVWVNGDHLMMVPHFIRAKFEKANIGFYFHSSFPAASIFHSQYRRNELLQSLLCSDIVGFHLFEYARNFMNACHRIFGLQYQFGVGGALSVIWHGRAIQVSVKHIGIDEGFIMHIRASKTYRKNEKQFKEEFKEITKMSNRSLNNQQRVETPSILANSRSHAFLDIIQQNQGLNTSEEELPSRSVSTSNSSADLQSLNKEALMTMINRRRTVELAGMQKPIIISSIDSFHPMAGIKQKLKAYQQFLRAYDDYRNRLVLIQFIPSILCLSDNLPNQGHPGEETKETTAEKKFKLQQSIVQEIPVMKELEADIKSVIKEIHDEFGQHSLVLMDSNPSLEKRLAIWSQTQILLVSTLKDGLCLPPLEFATVKKLTGEFENSGMILSEFSGCSSAFNGFHSFNPFDQQEFCKALDTCLSLSGKKKASMMRKAYKYCCFTTFPQWVENYLKELKESYNPNKHVQTRYIYLGLSTVDTMKAQLQLSHTSSQKLPQPINFNSVNHQFNHSTRCLIIINHEALPCKQYGKQHMQPQDQTIEYLSELSQDSRNIVCVFSNEEKDTVQKAFRKLPNIWLAAENGYWYKTDKSGWLRLFKQDSKVWLKILRKIFDQYCENIEGTVVDERESTISWNYKNAAEEHGLKFSKELYNQVMNLIGNNAPVQVIQGNGFIEVLPIQLKKEKLMKIILKNMKERSDRKIDFLLFIGCDPRDERSFEYLKRLTNQSKDQQNNDFSSDCKTKLCIIGKRPSNADFYLDSECQVAHLIQKLGQSTQSRKKNRSYSNLLNFNKPQSSLDFMAGVTSSNEVSNQAYFMDDLVQYDQNLREQFKQRHKSKLQKQRKISDDHVDMMIVEERPDEDDATVYQGQKIGETLLSPTHSLVDSQLKQFQNLGGFERHWSQDIIDTSKQSVQMQNEKNTQMPKTLKQIHSDHMKIPEEPQRMRHFSDVNSGDTKHLKQLQPQLDEELDDNILITGMTDAKLIKIKSDQYSRIRPAEQPNI